MVKSASVHVRALIGYAAVAVLYNWPLPLHLSSALTGRISGDTGVYVWNLWLFRHELVAHQRFPLFTHEILALSPSIDLSLHNYTLFANVLALPLIPVLGVTTTFNVIYLTLVVLTAWTMFVLARSVVGRAAEAWLAGLLFGFSPILVARSEAHFSLVAAAPLPIFALALMRAVRRRDPRYAALAGVAVAWASACDAYYSVFCVLMAACYLATRSFRLRLGARPPAPLVYRRTVDALALAAATIILVIVATGGTDLHLLGARVALRSLYTPVLMLMLLGIVRVALVVRPALEWQHLLPARVAAKLALAAAAACAVLMSPLLFALGVNLSRGGEFQGPIFWRSSPPGVDLLALFTPNPNSPLFGAPWRAWLTSRPNGYVENVASLTLVGVAVVALAVWRYRFRPPRAWLMLTVFFAALAVGPFLHVAGRNTFVIGPWALLRYVPLVSATRTPARFAIVMMMAFSVLFGLALARIGRSDSTRRRVLLVVVSLALAFELAPFPRQMFAATIPEPYSIVARDRRDVRVLELPFGIRDGEWSEGDFSASSQFYQTYHEKPLIGGYLSRISRDEVERQRQFPIIRALMRLSAGGALDAGALAALEAHGPVFVEQARLGYVVINSRRITPALRQFAVEVFRLVKIGDADGCELYVPNTGIAEVRAADSVESR